MSFSVDSLLNDALKLSMNLKECEIESDNLIHQTVTLNKDNENIKEYSEDMNVLSNTNVKQPRQTLIASIQFESKKMKQIEAENLELKDTLADYEGMMKVMSQKYRSHISKLINNMDTERKLKANHAAHSKYIKKIDEQSHKIENLNAIINKMINLDVENLLDIQKSLTRLELENEGLRQMLSIAKENNNLKSSLCTCDTSTQTEQSDLDLSMSHSPVNNVDVCISETVNNMSNLNISIDMDISSASPHSARKANNLSGTNYDALANSATIKKVIKDDHSKSNSTNEQA